MEIILGAKEWRKSVTRDLNGQPWHVSAGGNILPVVISVRAQLVQRQDNHPPYFSITGEVFNPRSRRQGGDGCLIGGCIHDEILHYFPQCAPLVEMHLCDIDGTPLYAGENTAYFAGFNDSRTPQFHTLAKHLGVTLDKAMEMYQWVLDYFGYFPDAYDSITTPAHAWRVAIDHFELPAEWARKAGMARAMLNSTQVGAVA
jgi:hypothetical protein